MNIIETISKDGIKSVPHDLTQSRMNKPQSGDIIDFGENEGKYPFIYGRYGRISDGPGEGFCKDDEIGVCCELGSAFISENGTVSISGGPFQTIKISNIESTFNLYEALVWNWGDNLPGANQGVHFRIPRPVFKLKTA